MNKEIFKSKIIPHTKREIKPSDGFCMMCGLEICQLCYHFGMAKKEYNNSTASIGNEATFYKAMLNSIKPADANGLVEKPGSQKKYAFTDELCNIYDAWKKP